jgi:hypothetical protein
LLRHKRRHQHDSTFAKKKPRLVSRNVDGVAELATAKHFVTSIKRAILRNVRGGEQRVLHTFEGPKSLSKSHEKHLIRRRSKSLIWVLVYVLTVRYDAVEQHVRKSG